MNEKELDYFVKCSCGSEGLHISAFKNEDELYISVWECGYGKDNRLDWKGRMRYIWRILTKGTPYGDQIVLTKEKAKELAEVIKSYVK